MCVSPCDTSYTSYSFSAWSLNGSGGTVSVCVKRKKKTKAVAAKSRIAQREMVIVHVSRLKKPAIFASWFFTLPVRIHNAPIKANTASAQTVTLSVVKRFSSNRVNAQRPSPRLRINKTGR